MTFGPRTAISPTASGPCNAPVTKSTALISTPGNGRPTVVRRLSSASPNRVIVTVGPVSVRPYATCTSHHPRIRLTSSSDTGPPATIPVRNDGKCAPLKRGDRISRWNIVGTPWSTVIASDSRSSTARSASNCSCITIVAPAATVPMTIETPKIVNNGTDTRTRSDGDISSASPVRTAVSTIVRCVRQTPLGFPMVPDVYRIARSLSSVTSSSEGSGRPAPLDRRSSNWKIRSSYHRSWSPTVIRI